ncbi:hypothetical protein LSAT2_024781 [Lamellibrachia satsuma]|nr:hypothetical protein LSAT2_024781 [Lamellibrachia satsuma]
MQVASFNIRMKVFVFIAAVCIIALVMPQTYAEEKDEAAVREARRVPGCTRDSDCKNGGQCIGHKCKCREYYIGNNCQTKRDCLKDSDCGNHGRCNMYGTLGCYCNPGYLGRYCELHGCDGWYFEETVRSRVHGAHAWMLTKKRQHHNLTSWKPNLSWTWLEHNLRMSEDRLDGANSIILGTPAVRSRLPVSGPKPPNWRMPRELCCRTWSIYRAIRSHAHVLVLVVAVHLTERERGDSRVLRRLSTDQVDHIIARMKVAVFFAAICIIALAKPQAYSKEEDEPAVREARGAKGAVMCAAKCADSPCKKICRHCAICYCSNGVYGMCYCCE